MPKGAADSVIKRSYRKLALQYHPVRPLFMTLRLALGCMGGTPAEGGLPPALLMRWPPCARQDKVKGSEEEKSAAAKKFADINHGVAPHFL